MSNSNIYLENRRELVFLFDARDANPNGDPDDSNRPRMDAETGENLVTDVRLKRTIRDYWISQGEEIFVRAEMDKQGDRKTMEALALEFLGREKQVSKSEANEARTKLANDLPKKYLDVRAFGAAITLTNANYSHTGTVQFGLGRSLNLPEVKSFTITSSLASTDEKGQGTIGEYHVVDYSLLRFHGIVSAVAARKLGFSEKDLDLLFKAMWNGIKNLNTRSKFNHTPRLFISIKYKKGRMQAGDLDLGVLLKSREKILKVEDAIVEIEPFIERIKQFQQIIESLDVSYDSALALEYNGEAIESIQDGLKKAGISLSVNQIVL